MNYEGFEDLRNDVATLSNEMYELKEKMRQLAQKYYWKSEQLTERLAGQIIYDLQTEQENIYKRINELDHHFKD